MADGSSFFGEQGGQRGGKVAAAAADTAIIEGFDVHVKVDPDSETAHARVGGIASTFWYSALKQYPSALQDSCI